MNGRLEAELNKQKLIKDKLKYLPKVFEEFYYYMEEDDRSYNTIEHYIDYNVEFMNYITNGNNDEYYYKNVNSTHIKQFISSQRTKEINGELVRIGDSILATKFSAIKKFFSFLIDSNYIDENPIEGVRRPKVKTDHTVTFLEEDEINKLFLNIKTMANERLLNRDLCMFSLFISTGLRKSALVQINVEDVNFKTNTIKVIEKGRKERLISFGGNMRQLLLNWIQDRRDYFKVEESGPLFVSQWNNRMSTKNVEMLLAKYLDGVSDKHITVHKLRATAATQMAAHDVPVQVIKEMLNHENVSTTMRYVAAIDSQKQEAVNILDSIVK